MKKTMRELTSKRLSAMVVALAASAALAGCSGSKGDTGAQGSQGPAGAPGSSGSGTTATVSRLYARIKAVSVPNATTTGGSPTVTYQLFTDAAMTQAAPCAGGTGGYAAFTPNFTIAKLVADPVDAKATVWKSYLNKQINTPPVTVATIEGSHDTVAGTLKDNGDGTCSYTYAADLSKKVSPSATVGVTEAYEPTAVTRFGMQNNPSEPSATQPAFDGFVDVVPATGAIQAADPRQIVSDAACNACHQQIAHHGAKRLSVGYCVTCHNASTPDPDPTSVNSTSLDLAAMIHKIHQGKNLPSVSGKSFTTNALAGGATAQTLVVNGTDYSAVGFPQDTGNCTVCHAVTSGTAAGYWKSEISIANCTSCHDRTSFDATPPAGYLAHAPVADGSCAFCHGPNSALDVAKVHALAAPGPAQQQAKFTILGVTQTAPGQFPVVQFSVTDPTNGGANEDLATDARWKAGANSRLFVTIAWTTKAGDWNNAGAGKAGQPLTIGVVNNGAFAPATVNGQPNPGTTVKNADGTYTVTSTTAIPANAVGSGAALIEGHPGSAAASTANFNNPRFAVTNATQFFPVTDATAVPRRDVVDVAKCDKCHGLLSLHGNNRTDDINSCVICHNVAGTDVSRRSGATMVGGKSTLDNKAEQSIQLAVMVHAIHSGAHLPYTPGIVVYGFGGSTNDFRDVSLPEGNSIGKCGICHTDAAPIPHPPVGLAEDVTVGNANGTDQTVYYRVSKTAAVCSSCHANGTAFAHMVLNGAYDSTPASPAVAGANYNVLSYDLDPNLAVPAKSVETCSVCHGPGAIADTAVLHGK
ncbi:OmcA/MtrC family decaheme c-type cytochrome [Anaeromyxobacter paludicola]|nr:OmcA/MtrC family decaheme c-type cytochrome [Anaeromyxobacter paludicola]